jgi:hypothetical protein
MEWEGVKSDDEVVRSKTRRTMKRQGDVKGDCCIRRRKASKVCPTNIWWRCKWRHHSLMVATIQGRSLGIFSLKGKWVISFLKLTSFIEVASIRI